jgi:hypothetical protein
MKVDKIPAPRPPNHRPPNPEKILPKKGKKIIKK